MRLSQHATDTREDFHEDCCTSAIPDWLAEAQLLLYRGTDECSTASDAVLPYKQLSRVSGYLMSTNAWREQFTRKEREDVWRLQYRCQA
jgi:hypothetical protein